MTNSDLVDRFKVEAVGAYSSYRVVTCDRTADFGALIESVPEPAHLLVISPGCLFESPLPEALGRRKLLAMACNSTPTPLEAIAAALDSMERTDPVEQAASADRFFDGLEAAERVEIADADCGTRAVFDHHDERYEWNQQAGGLEWGQQQLAPSGELSALPADIMSFDPSLRLAVNGEIALSGPPVLHSGAASFSRDDQARIFGALSCADAHPVIATVEDGLITGVRATDEHGAPAADMLSTLFEIDSRYRVVWEMGFGINAELRLQPGNLGINEPYGGEHGVFHLGMGLTPFTQYALIFLCPGSRVLGRDGATLLGRPRRGRMVRRRSGSCGCHA